MALLLEQWTSNHRQHQCSAYLHKAKVTKLLQNMGCILFCIPIQATQAEQTYQQALAANAQAQQATMAVCCTAGVQFDARLSS